MIITKIFLDAYAKLVSVAFKGMFGLDCHSSSKIVLMTNEHKVGSNVKKDSAATVFLVIGFFATSMRETAWFGGLIEVNRDSLSGIENGIAESSLSFGDRLMSLGGGLSAFLLGELAGRATWKVTGGKSWMFG